MKKVTEVNIYKAESCCGNADSSVAQCCAKSTKLVMGCHD